MTRPNPNHPQFTIRRGAVSDVARLCALFEREYGDSSHPCLDERFVRRAISHNSEIWFVAEEERGAAIGCVSVSYNVQNRSWEFGRAMISQRHRQLGVLSSLMQSVIDAMPTTDHDLAFAIARNDVALRALQAHVDSVVVGHDGAPNMVHGVHEHHVVAIGKFPSPGFKHCSPLAPIFRESAFLQSELLEPLGLAGAPEPYPDICFWGHGDDFCDGFTFRRDDRVNALYLCRHIGGPFMTELDIAADLLRFLKRHDTHAYVGAIVLADKSTLIRTMLETGFRITAYLPAWHWSRGARYDCVLLARRGPGLPAKNGMDRHIDTLDAAYQEIAQRILAA
ncbi:GNAT family N-acetyltransferase [Burkholderia sp. AW49-1]